MPSGLAKHWKKLLGIIIWLNDGAKKGILVKSIWIKNVDKFFD